MSNDTTMSKPAMMVTQEGTSTIGGMIENPPIERDTDMAEVSEAGGVVGAMQGKTTRVAFMAEGEQWECNKNTK